MTTQKTIRLAPTDYRLHDGRVQVLRYERTGYEARDGSIAEMMREERAIWGPSKYQIGARVVLVSTTDLRAKSAPVYRAHFDLDGVSGNSDPTIKLTHGWRGTTDDVSVDAHGIWRIVGIRGLRRGEIAVTLRKCAE